ncbi:MAG: EF-P beta-lysylation protein EpmB [Kangiellaceae bacterium]|nr:EF-P beta-lysylation protein EpmB [Kangiellaceae bacterium]
MKNSAPIIPVSNSDCQLNSWKTELKSAFSSPQELLQYLAIDATALDFEIDTSPTFKLRVPRPFADKMQPGNINDPLLLQVLSSSLENVPADGFVSDPLQEQNGDRPGLLHKYHGRVLLLVTGSCAVNCRYCFRRHFPYQSDSTDDENLRENIGYIAKNKDISEVILSGGDPLIAGDKQLERLIRQLESIKHIRRLRIHTRLPIVIPQRITPMLIKLLSETSLQTSMVVHTNHANEIDKQTGRQLQGLVQSGTTVLNQAVFLKNINDSSAAQIDLSEKLFKYQILPYYLHLLDPVKGASHFYQTKQKALQVMNELRNYLPGYLVPKLALEEPNKPSKSVISS